MDQQQYDQLYADLCKVIDNELFYADLHQFEVPTTRGRRCVNQILEVLARHNIVIGVTADEETNSTDNDQP